MNIKKVGIVGCGAMGTGIAQVSAQAGYQTLILDTSNELLDRGIDLINNFLSKGVEKGKISLEDKEAIINRLTASINIQDLVDCDLVIEAVFEEIELKKKTFIELDKVCKEHTILATNTSALSVTDIALTTNRYDKVIGMHFFNPVPIMKLVELIKTDSTSEESLKTGKDFIRSLGKTVVTCKDTPGFIVNRLSMGLALNAIRMLESGVATKEDIDIACVDGLNYPMGPLAMADFAGVDILYRGATVMYERFGDPQYAPPALLQKMIAAGWYGRKTGKGFYEYQK